MHASIDSAADAEPHAVHAVIAAREEAARIAATIGALRRSFELASLVVADDGSRDATAEIARALGARVVGTRAHRGKGAAMSLAAASALDGVRRAAGAVAAREALFLLCDGDLGESAGELGALVAAVADGEADIAVGAFARPLGGGFGIARAFARWATRARGGAQLRAVMSGQRALRGGALEALLPFADGYGMELGMTIDAARAGLRVRELELALSHRASARTPAGFAHRAGQLLDMLRAYRARGAA